MAEPIKKFIIRDKHGAPKKQGSFSVVGEVHVDIVPGVGEPYAESEYVDGVLNITIHNIEGNGITDITTDSQEGDEAVNTVTIKTNDNPEGVTLEVRNGSRGNGIASSSEVLSPDDGGINTHTIVDTDGIDHVFHTRNGKTGTQGPQGDSFQPIEDVSGLVLAHTTGQDDTIAITQKAVTDFVHGGMIRTETTATSSPQCYVGSQGKTYYVDGNDGQLKYWQGGSVRTWEVELTPDIVSIGYRTSSFTGTEKGGYAFVDDNGNYISGVNTTSAANVTINAVDAIAAGATKFRCSRKTTTDNDITLTIKKEAFHWPARYDDTGNNIDGSMTQKAVSEYLANMDSKMDALKGYTMLNQIMRIGTTNPSVMFLQNFAGDQGCCAINNIADADSPFKDLLGYMTKLATVSGQTACYRYENALGSAAQRTNKPTKISVAFWINEDDIASFSSSTNAPNISFRDSGGTITTFNMNSKGVIAQPVGYVSASSSVSSNTMTATYVKKHMAKVGKWHQIGYVISNIEWLTNNKWEYGLLLNGTMTYWNEIRLVNFQIVEGDEIPSGVVLLQDVGGTMAYFDGGIKIIAEQVDQLQEKVDEMMEGKTSVFHYASSPGSTSSITSQLTHDKQIKVNFVIARTPSFGSDNPCFNFTNVSVNNTVVNSCGDDVAPARFNGSYLGANHGDSDIKLLTATSHGKSYADIGSKWSMGGNTYTIVGISSANALLMLGENTQTYPKFQFRQATAGTYTHVSGAAHTENIVATAVSASQMRPSYAIADKNVYVDGKETTASGDYQCNRVDICEIYDIFNVASLLQKIQDKAGTFTSNPVFSELGADKVARQSIVYTFMGAGLWLVGTTLTFYQAANLMEFICHQAAPIGMAQNNPKLYIPKTLPINNKDYRAIVDYGDTVETKFNSSYWEIPSSPPDRFIENMDSIGFSIGYLIDYGDAASRADNVTNAIMLSSVRKIYPFVVNGSKNVAAGTSYSAVAYRKYHDPSAFNKNGVIMHNVFEYDNKLYIYADYNTAGYYEIPIPSKYLGKKIQVIEKSNNVSLLTPLASSKLLVNVTMGVNDVYGYLVAQIK